MAESQKDEQSSSVDGRIKTFMERYQELVSELKVDFVSYPVFVPDGQGGFRTIVQSTPVDTSNQPVKSPLVGEAK